MCGGKGIVGNLCTSCEDSGMIYEALSEQSAEEDESSGSSEAQSIAIEDAVASDSQELESSLLQT